MTLNLTMPGQDDLKPRITVFGVGGAGGNAVNNMIDKALEGVDFVVANTDAQALLMSDADIKLDLGREINRGLGAGANPEVGQAAAEAHLDRYEEAEAAYNRFLRHFESCPDPDDLGDAARQAAEEAGVRLTPDPFPDQNMFVRSDHYRFVQRGVPSLFLMTGPSSLDGEENTLPVFEGFLAEHYHKPTDDLHLPINYNAAARFTEINTRIGEIVADLTAERAVRPGRAVVGAPEPTNRRPACRP